MFSIHKFLSRTGRLGTPLPTPYPIFDIERVKFRYGGTSMLAGKPGSFKSILALNLMTRWAEMGLSALYFSADSDEFTVARRIAGILTDTDSGKVDADFEQRKYAPYMTALASLGESARFEYRAFDDIEEIYKRVNLYELVYGGYPDLIFIDNLINFAPSTDDWGAMRDMTNAFDGLARETKTHVCVLHHASEGYGEHSDPVPSKAIQGKVSQIPRLVLTTAAAGTDLAVAAVKNTNGPQFPSADHTMPFKVQPSLRVTDNYEEML